jgi:hypothetical protein
VFTVNRSISPAPSYAPAASPRLRRRPSPWPPHRHAKSASKSTHPTGRSCTAPRPLSTRFEPVPRLRSFTTGSSRMPSDPARRTRPVWQSRIVPALSALLPALPDVSRVRLRSAPTRLLRQPGEEVLHLPRLPAPHGAREVDPERGAGLTTGPFLRVASRTRRAPLGAPGSPQVPWVSCRLMWCSAMVLGCVFPGSSSAWRALWPGRTVPLRRWRAICRNVGAVPSMGCADVYALAT